MACSQLRYRWARQCRCVTSHWWTWQFPPYRTFSQEIYKYANSTCVLSTTYKPIIPHVKLVSILWYPGQAINRLSHLLVVWKGEAPCRDWGAFFPNVLHMLQLVVICIPHVLMSQHINTSSKCHNRWIHVFFFKGLQLTPSCWSSSGIWLGCLLGTFPWRFFRASLTGRRHCWAWNTPLSLLPLQLNTGYVWFIDRWKCSEGSSHSQVGLDVSLVYNV